MVYGQFHYIGNVPIVLASGKNHETYYWQKNVVDMGFSALVIQLIKSKFKLTIHI